MANWTIHAAATRQAQKLFRAFQPEIRGNGRQYVVTPTPFGRVEFIPVRGGFLIAAEAPPPGDGEWKPEALSETIARHLTANGLQAWKVIPTQDVVKALEYLVRRDPPAGRERAPEAVSWSPYLRRIEKPVRLIGSRREALVERLRGLVTSQGPGAPLPALAGPAGVGRHVISAAVAERAGMAPVELPLARLLVDRILSTPAETFLDTVLTAGACLADGDLLIVSDAELLGRMTTYQRRQALLELGRLRTVMLMVTTGVGGGRCPSGVVALSCAGLADEKEGASLLAEHFPRVAFVGPSVAMLCRAARMASLGIIPARLLFLARLGFKHKAHAGEPQRFFPDDAATAMDAAARAWEGEHAGREKWGNGDE